MYRANAAWVSELSNAIISYPRVINNNQQQWFSHGDDLAQYVAVS